MRKRNCIVMSIVVLMAALSMACAGFALRHSEVKMAYGKEGSAGQSAAAFQAQMAIFDVRDYGAVGDGKTLNTAAFQTAIDACTKANGGTVYVPAGDFLLGTVELKSNVTLHLAPMGRILGSDKIKDYRAGTGVPGGNGNIVLLYAANAKNVTIEGTGTIDGQGASFYTGKGDGSGPGPKNTKGEVNVNRPHLLIFYKCEKLLIRDVFMTRSAYHCMRILDSKYVHFDGIRIYNRVNKNNDGFHFNGCEYVNISNCNIICQDDACALFGSNKFVTVTNCSFSTRWSIFRFGSGNSENITVSNCLIYETYGCPIKISGGGRTRIENMSFSNLIMKNVTGPISINLGGSRSGRLSTNTLTASGPLRPAASDAPTTRPMMRNISFSNIQASVVPEPLTHPDLAFPVSIYPGERNSCIVLNGVGDNYIENIKFSDIHVTYPGGGTAEDAAREVPQVGGEYFLIGTRPAYGMYARNVRGLTLKNVRFDMAKPDLRPAVVFDHVKDAAVVGLSVQGNEKAASALRFIDTQDVLLTAPRLLTPVPSFLKVEGAGSEGIKVDGGDYSKAGKPLTFDKGAEAKMVKIKE